MTFFPIPQPQYFSTPITIGKLLSAKVTSPIDFHSSSYISIKYSSPMLLKSSLNGHAGDFICFTCVHADGPPLHLDDFRYGTVKGQAVACPFIYIMHKCCCLNLRHEVSTDNAYFLRVLTFYRLSNEIVIR